MASSITTFFPFFMLVAFEGGSIFRALLLLLTWPAVWSLRGRSAALKVMVFVTFCGMKIKNVEIVARSVLPKFYPEINLPVCTGDRILTRLPRVLVEAFLTDYVGVESVGGMELHTCGIYYTGLSAADSGLLVKEPLPAGEKRTDFGDQLFISQERDFILADEDNKPSPKPVIFHDGRLAFLPTPLATLTMFIWIPFGIILAAFRLTMGIILPYKLVNKLGVASGVVVQFNGPAPETSISPDTGRSGILYVCNHRTLLDPVFLSTALEKPLTAVTYSLSRLSELLAPIKTVRMTRDRHRDAAIINRLLSDGDVVVCPEGTTCREPYLLRFSSLFAELAEEIVPVAINTRVSMFYGTTASGMKFLDPIFFLMNPRPCYMIQILEKVPPEMSVAGGRTSYEVANHIQKLLGEVLGFQCTNLTRRDKYMLLAGNEWKSN